MIPYAITTMTPIRRTFLSIGIMPISSWGLSVTLQCGHFWRHRRRGVNVYVHDPTQTDKVVFTTEAIENIPAGWRARETYIVHGTDEFEETFELASRPPRPDKPNT